MNIQKLIIEDVRCFAGRQEFNIRPLTFLAGENSTGKSTVLGCFDALHRFTSMRTYGSDLDFNAEPYQMGVFADIVRRSTPKKKSFRLGFEFRPQNNGEGIKYFLTLIEEEKGSEPVVQEQRVIFSKNEIVFESAQQEVEESDKQSRFHRTLEVTDLSEKEGNKQFRARVLDEPLTRMNVLGVLDYVRFMLRRERKNLSPVEKEFQIWVENIWELFTGRLHDTPREDSYSFAPIRSKPQRTYDPLKETASPEGSDIPMVLMNMFRTNEKEWKELRGRLIEFGKSSGLFSDIHVRRLGKSMGDPFQLQIKVKGPKVNMIDVGYGVNQLLPILVRILNSRPRVSFLMQQPEVHLHPRGQAELSSLLVGLVKQREHKFIVETHSDYMVDRARIEIMKKRIAPEDVSLIYLEPAGNSVKVHNIEFDEQANLLGVPSSYREFFLRESDDLLGFIED